MFSIRIYFHKILSKPQNKECIDNIEYNPQNIENVLKKFNELTSYINALENSLKTAEHKTHIYEDRLQKYERVFKEEIDVYRLHKSNISIINQTLNDNELFINEIQEHIQSYLASQNNDNNNANQAPPFNRIFTRFFHQNKLYKYRMAQKLTNLNETIVKKNRLLERMHGEIQTWNTPNTTRLMPTQQLAIKQAVS